MPSMLGQQKASFLGSQGVDKEEKGHEQQRQSNENSYTWMPKGNPQTNIA